ncbi:twin-arginine translocation pathway signal protein [Spongiactinospora rosea]|uniref:Twin-arginine translocation pathway signal protein n=1 Tax=Spongiactinospora rosea TaxID=2248750 RepID=A0A366LQ07_9ACTN|nr:sulfatase-like hydrolase/transferase [Spongiactinospora rosea]RBQ16025.1 twin-arginine translocation pathway signal protein [Spongiactinospora rosea]
MGSEDRSVSRREIAVKAGGVAAAAAAGAVLPGGAAEAAPEEQEFRAAPGKGRPARPNVLVILGDDLGWADLGCYGSPHIRTPNLDRLARDGVRFTNAYSAAAVCSPTRFALYTGRYPGRLRGGLEEPIARPGEQLGIPPDHPTLASLLKGAGYATAMFGKWHCGFLPWYSPLKSGWDVFFGNLSGAVDYYSKISSTGVDLYEGEVQVESLDYYTDTIADRAAEYIRRRHDGPWLLNLNFTTPHWPWEAPGDREVSAEITARVKAGDSGALTHRDGGSLATYRKMVQSLDSAVGRVLAALRSSGAERNTIVLFSSDNGGERWSYQWPLSGGKGGLNEGGIRVPNILRWPAAIHRGQVGHVPVITHDWTATILEAAGVRPAAGHPLDGHSLLPYLLDGARPPRRDLFWRTRSARALRRGDWKYLRTGSGEALFNLAADVREQADLAERDPALLTDLRTTWENIDKTLLPYPT